MRRTIAVIALLVSTGIITHGNAAAQEPQEEAALRVETLRVFLDCANFFCDFDHLRREIRFVNWVRDRTNAQVHIMGTAQTTGGGGREFTFTFIGLREFEGQQDTLKYVSRQTDTEAEIRAGQTRTLKLGLMRYVAETPAAERITISYRPLEQEVQTEPEEDPWNYWVFTSRIGSFFSGESQSSSYSGNGSFSARRTTERHKISFSIRGSYSESEFKVTDTLRYRYISRSYHSYLNSVWSLGPHWSIGARASAGGTTYLNQDLEVSIAPAVEYNIFPYEESTRREFTFQYSAGPVAVDYEEETIFFKTREVYPQHMLSISVQFKEPWGSVSTSLHASQHLDDLEKHSAGLFGSIDIRIVKGLSLNLFASIDRIKDQIYLSGKGLMLEEILLRRRQMGTDYMFFGNIGISYTFGSMFNNIVNPRMWF